MPPVKRASAKKVLPSRKEEAWDVSNAAATDHAPSVTVFTNIAGAVAVTVDRDSSIVARRRISSKPLPENVFNPFRERRSRRREPAVPNGRQSSAEDNFVVALAAAEENPHVTSAAAAAIAVEGIKKGVRDALDRWALQT